MHEMLRNLSEKLRTKFPATTHGYVMLKLPVSMVLSEFFELEASPVEGQSLKEKNEKRRKKERPKKSLKEETKGLGACPSKIVI